MIRHDVPVCECNVCHHRWLAEGAIPKRYPSRKCRAVNWNDRGEAQLDEHRPPKPSRAGSTPVTPAKLTVHKVGEALVNPNSETLADSRSYLVQTKEVDIAELRKICAGEIVKPATDYAEPPAEPAPVRVCMSCLEPMREVKGKWACMDVSCGMYGREQNHRKMLMRA